MRHICQMKRLYPAFFVALFIILACAAAKAAPATTKPNILMFAIDDLNDWVGCMGGHPQVKTPNIDRLAARGTVFLNAHCQAPLCNPSRTSLMLGLRPTTTGIYALEPWMRDVPALKPMRTLPQYFEDNGYRTFAVGKVHHYNKPGEFTTTGKAGGAGPLPPKKFVKTPSDNRLVDWGEYPDDDTQQGDWKVADWAIQQLKSMDRSKPFFICVGFSRPHVPCYASKKWFKLYPPENLILPKIRQDERDDLPEFSWYLHWKLPEPRLEWLQENNQLVPLVRAYLASVSFMDSQVGRVLDALKEQGLDQNTIVVFWGDNGFHLGEKGISGKNSLWERSTRVPLIFAGPGVADNGRCTRPAELLDVYPTLVEMCNLPKKSDLEGHSLVPQLKDARAPRDWPAITSHGPDNHTVRTEQWRYIRYADGSEELYDMMADPEEWKNLAAKPDFASIKARLAEFLPKNPARPVPGSVSRLIEMRNGKPYWEGKEITDDDEPSE